ncbi:unnamed protein product [Hymenolepis diminuta]|uniref:Transmembrane protein n=1 Tax=Hymenolepis diminuta TaxID=6216 RepID=A0A0R3SHY3_HYMDI|nr:unnamed protein product [Hymenolepis diminuta]VUZ44721.1 unnamed protein product [Hymenolepis diminuta]
MMSHKPGFPLCLRRLVNATILTASTAPILIFIFYHHNPIFRSFKQLLSSLTDQAPTASNHSPALSQAPPYIRRPSNPIVQQTHIDRLEDERTFLSA